MNGQKEIFTALLSTIDKGAIGDLRTFLQAHRGVTKWMVTSDYCIGDQGRTRDALAFTLVPYDAEFAQLKADASAGLRRDLKDIKYLSPEGVAYLRDERRFHLVVMLDRDRQVIADHTGVGQSALLVAREAAESIVQNLPDQSAASESLKRARAYRERTRANSFNVKLFGDQIIVSAILGLLAALLIREAGARAIGWFSDRDAIVDFGDGLFWDMTITAARGISESLGLEHSGVEWLRAGPDPEPAAQAMWFDDFLRTPDHLAGALSAWDLDANLVPGKHRKYLQLIQDVVADAKNIVVLQLVLDERGTAASRLAVTRNPGPEEVAA